MKLCVVITLALILAGCGGSSRGASQTPTLLPAAGGDAAWAKLESRPLDLPAVSTGKCPVAERHEVNPDYSPALGSGPFYPVGFDDTSTLEVGEFPIGGDWLGEKVLWVGSPDFSGLALVRGGRLDAPGRVGFGGNLIPDAELRIDTTTPTGAHAVPPSGGPRRALTGTSCPPTRAFSSPAATPIR